MLVNPAIQQPAYTAQPAPVPNGVGQTDVVRSDLPPIEQAPEPSAGQNQQLQSDGRFQETLRQTPESTAEPAAESNTSASNGGQDSSTNTSAPSGKSDGAERAAEQQRQEDTAIIQQLKARDREVRLHEAAHAAVGGRYAGSPSLQYERGPDGVNYAVSGEVSISVSKAATPEQTLEKARQIRAAATAPAEPSAQDRAVAAEASRLEAQARSDIQAQEVEQSEQRGERVDESSNEDREAERVAAEKDSDAAETVSVADTQAPQESTPTIASQNADRGESERSSDTESDDSQDDKNAREQLEEILLGNQSVPEALNRAGLVDAQNPYGKSGFIEYIV